MVLGGAGEGRGQVQPAVGTRGREGAAGALPEWGVQEE